MKTQYTRQLRMLGDSASLALENKNMFFAAIFLFLTGISAGVFLELIMSPEEKIEILSYLQQYLSADGSVAFPSPFYASVSNNLILLFLLFLAGITIIGFPAALLVLLYKGIGLGFSAGLLLESQRENGAFLILSSLVPQNLFLIPVFILAASGVLNYSFTRLKGSTAIKKSRASSVGSLVILILLLAVAVVIGAGVEAILYPIVLSS